MIQLLLILFILFAVAVHAQSDYVLLIEEMVVLNSPSPDHSPFIDPHERYIILSSFHGEYGSSDLFISFKEEDGTWLPPVNMGPTINSVAKDEYP